MDTPLAPQLPPRDFQASSIWPFRPLLSVTAPSTSPAAERVLDLLSTQRAVLKTMKDDELCWSTICRRLSSGSAFHTSTSLPPDRGKSMKLYGTLREFPCGLIFELPEDLSDEAHRPDARKPPNVYSWNSGYSAKTEFNMDSRGNLFNGREEALTTIAELRAANQEYLEAISKNSQYTLRSVPPREVEYDYVPFNEVFVQVGGDMSHSPSLTTGLGQPVALFTRLNSYFHLVALMRAQMRFMPHAIPLLLLDSENEAVAISDEGETMPYPLTRK